MSKARHARPRRSTRRVVRTLSIAGLGAGITAAGAGGAFAADYKVKAGDTLSEIAQATGADWHQLAELNNLENPDLILIGQTLKLDGVKKPAVRPTEKKRTSQQTRTVKKKTVKKVERKAPGDSLRQPPLRRRQREHERSVEEGRQLRVQRQPAGCQPERQVLRPVPVRQADVAQCRRLRQPSRGVGSRAADARKEALRPAWRLPVAGLRPLPALIPSLWPAGGTPTPPAAAVPPSVLQYQHLVGAYLELVRNLADLGSHRGQGFQEVR